MLFLFHCFQCVCVCVCPRARACVHVCVEREGGIVYMWQCMHMHMLLQYES